MEVMPHIIIYDAFHVLHIRYAILGSLRRVRLAGGGHKTLYISKAQQHTWLPKVRLLLFLFSVSLHSPTQPFISEMRKDSAASGVSIPTSLNDSFKGDIYSFGMIMWEVFHKQRPWAQFAFFQVRVFVTKKV